MLLPSLSKNHKFLCSFPSCFYYNPLFEALFDIIPLTPEYLLFPIFNILFPINNAFMKLIQSTTLKIGEMFKPLGNSTTKYYLKSFSRSCKDLSFSFLACCRSHLEIFLPQMSNTRSLSQNFLFTFLHKLYAYNLGCSIATIVLGLLIYYMHMLGKGFFIFIHLACLRKACQINYFNWLSPIHNLERLLSYRYAYLWIVVHKFNLQQHQIPLSWFLSNQTSQWISNTSIKYLGLSINL